MNEPFWIEKAALLLVHGQVLAEHGGLEGIRDEGLLESALARPKNLYAYEGVEDLPRLAVSYAAGILRNHPFADGNKRMAFIALSLFLARNGSQLQADPLEAGRTFWAAATGELHEEDLVAWVVKNIVADPQKKT